LGCGGWGLAPHPHPPTPQSPIPNPQNLDSIKKIIPINLNAL